MTHLLLGLEQVDKTKLTKEQKEEITNNVSCLLGFASTASNASVMIKGDDIQKERLSFTAEFLSDLAGELNGLIQA